ncbi:ThuA domain-containing protein [Chitinophaga alhagiae]|uniref:ThuA domain-containing protein n=1 Tax=Chitinophaga alhagiae TaxID=2203219 RepID=UPI001E5C673A|nr:ThuA domain-containing protein [Chitinophaga alhagiae]
MKTHADIRKIAGRYNMLPNILWTVVNLAPVYIFCCRHVQPLHFGIILSMKKRILPVLLLAVCTSFNTTRPPKFRVLVLAEAGGHHIRFTEAATVWLNKLAADSGFTVDYIQHTTPIHTNFLRQYRLFIQLDYPPYGWTKAAAEAFEAYITTGKGGWIGFHHATLLGEFDGYPMWPWFSRFMGNIRFKDYIAEFASGRVVVEDQQHPVMRGLPGTFVIEKEEWYTYNRSPRPDVQVIASVDESSYRPDSHKKMGDHPVIWSNPHVKARNVYIFMGHSPGLFDNVHYKMLFRNAVAWAAGEDNAP